MSETTEETKIGTGKCGLEMLDLAGILEAGEGRQVTLAEDWLQRVFVLGGDQLTLDHFLGFFKDLKKRSLSYGSKCDLIKVFTKALS